MRFVKEGLHGTGVFTGDLATVRQVITDHWNKWHKDFGGWIRWDDAGLVATFDAGEGDRARSVGTITLEQDGSVVRISMTAAVPEGSRFTRSQTLFAWTIRRTYVRNLQKRVDQLSGRGHDGL